MVHASLAVLDGQDYATEHNVECKFHGNRGAAVLLLAEETWRMMVHEWLLTVGDE